ncbi:hypothetical protein [Cellulosimicrobium cellulans]|uniref:hypothetical protein n=1 Tax=Cellulosimicrobium cellulans TaxID=1710 RepID=UPI0003131ABF|nr:hypothetical protein [Cellulosimicrobium cellulans]
MPTTTPLEPTTLRALRPGDRFRVVGELSWATVRHVTATSITGVGPSGEWHLYFDEAPVVLAEVVRADVPRLVDAARITLHHLRDGQWNWHSTFHLPFASSTVDILKAHVPCAFVGDVARLLEAEPGARVMHPWHLLTREA